MTADTPRRYVATMGKAKWGGKILVDDLRD
jgi:hypothetical protein